MKIKGHRFTKEIDNIISEHMKNLGHLPNPYMKIHEKIPKYSSKQIRYRWISKLNPYLCTMPLEDNEKLFIVQWVENNRTSDGIIHWKDLIKEVESKFGKLRSENTLKNFWHLRRRSLSKQFKEVNYDEPNITFEYENLIKEDNLSLFKNKDEENISPLPSDASRIEILCWVASEQHKRDFPYSKYFK
ncbi:unnamed protein product [Rhizophagus irregularis]|uniref:HTH myb-type domain-containing protein n=1 Tax=Rhizophagus irregularis TaxID=588596 RepID=A0A2N1N2E6_9GLOM|nr:hypothetical protein RhiirC2_867489 [Rhizophagus irregularis]CAB4383692.1 unnamed protein product [Rhizophagus irregularis]CAB5353298.1 unnamed protein product [Rhizophagus irregularis]